MARLALAVGMNVIAWTFHANPQRARELGVPFVSLDELLGAADVISLHVKLTEQSRGLIGTREFALMKPGALFINTARGAVVDTPALVAALDSSKLGGAGIHVSDIDPVRAHHPLRASQHLLLT